MSNNETIPNHPVTLRSSPEARHQPRAAREPSPAGPPPGGVELSRPGSSTLASPPRGRDQSSRVRARHQDRGAARGAHRSPAVGHHPDPVNRQTLNVGAIVQALQTGAGLFATLSTAEQQAKVSVTQARQAINRAPSLRALITGLDDTLRGFFGQGNSILETFGVASRARKVTSTLTKAKAARTGALTRQARHTMGKRQRLSVTGGAANVQLTGPDGAVLAGTAGNGVGSSK